MSAQKIKPDQVWERIRDGVRVRVESYDPKWDDVTWYRDDVKRRGAIFGSYLRDRYRLVEEA